ncbi:MAG: helix-turn-helix transcriptional regulator, partial [Lachnospiraceae bacterium]|nr:helix-turn-helix transcriptional regulator [Lachnospiraceae bacterium]
MGNEKMARFICDLRKSKNLTQRQLADQLHVTDKAVSKWERGLSCPDISLLPALSDILGVTTRELLNGEKAIESAPETETIVKKTLAYADTAAKSQLRKSRFAFALVVSAISLIAIIICIICNYAIEGGLSWAWYP